VIAVSKSGKSFSIQLDTATRTDGHGMSDAQSYTHKPDSQGAIYVVRASKSKGWKCGLGRVSLGMRSTYHDFSF
jgi:hypothetical protein